MAKTDSTEQPTLFDGLPSEKACRDCGQTKPINEFHRNPRMRDGRLNTCRECVKKQQRSLYERRRASPEPPEDIPKRCSVCGEVKPLRDFNRNTLGTHGRAADCKKCRSAHTKLARQEFKKDPEWRHKSHLSHSTYNLRTKYGLSRDEYEVMHANQNGLCAICGKPETAIHYGRYLQLGVDHNHRTGAVRELLCSFCNRGLGNFLDDPELLMKAIAYLKKHQSQSD